MSSRTELAYKTSFRAGGDGEMERAAGIAPAIPAWKAGVYLSTPRPHD